MEDFMLDTPKSEVKVVVEIPFDKIQKAVYDSIEGILKSTYGNPVKDAVEKAFKEKSSDVDRIVKEIIADSLNNVDFKQELGKLVMGKMFENAFKR